MTDEPDNNAKYQARLAALRDSMDAVTDRGTHHWDREGKPIGLAEWCALLERVLNNGEQYRRVAEDEVGPLWVSTVWLGIDHGWHSKVPIIFETMIFDKNVRAPGASRELWEELHGLCWRYATELEAKRTHEMIVHRLREVLDKPALTPGDMRQLMSNIEE